MELQTTAGAVDLLPFLPQSVARVSCVLPLKGAIQAWTLDVVLEGLFIDPFVDITLGALEVTRGLFKVVLVSGRWSGELRLDEVPYDLRTCELFGGPGGILSWLWAGLLCKLLSACFTKSIFKLLGCETLVHACTAGCAGETAPLWGPPVVIVLPGLRALLDEIFLPLFGLLAWLPVCFGVQVVLLILEDLLQPLCCLKVDGFMVLVKCFLPAGLSAVMESIRPLPGS